MSATWSQDMKQQLAALCRAMPDLAAGGASAVCSLLPTCCTYKLPHPTTGTPAQSQRPPRSLRTRCQISGRWLGPERLVPLEAPASHSQLAYLLPQGLPEPSSGCSSCLQAVFCNSVDDLTPWALQFTPSQHALHSSRQEQHNMPADQEPEPRTEPKKRLVQFQYLFCV
jgi:hypothetical protein